MIDQTNCKILKLSSGETIVCSTDMDDDYYSKQTISIVDPVIIKHVRIPREDMIIETYILMPWCSYSEDDVFQISTSHIILSANAKEGLRKNYLEYIMEKNNPKEEDLQTEEIEEILGSLQERLENGYEDEDEDDGNSGRGNRGSTRILH